MSYSDNADVSVVNEIGLIPNELSLPAAPLVFFTGLNIVSNQNHLYIWESFSCNRANDRTLIHYQLVESQFTLLHSKLKVCFSGF